MLRKIFRIKVISIVVISLITVEIAALISLKWRYMHDSPIMIYAGYLMSEGYVPYKDFFDMNMPGTYFVMMVVGRIFGWSDLAFRFFDLLCLASISISTFLWLHQKGKLTAIVAPIAFALWYLGSGPTMSLQREYLALVPFTAVLALSCSNNTSLSRIRTFLSGVLISFTMLIKPQFFLLSLPIIICLYIKVRSDIFFIKKVILFFSGVLIPIIISVFFLYMTNGLKPFLDIVFNYLPLYSHMTGYHTPISGINRIIYIINETFIGLENNYTLIAELGLIILYMNKRFKYLSQMIILLLVASFIYPAIAGQFWPYHWIPYHYLVLCSASFIIIPISEINFKTIFLTFILFLFLFSLSFQFLSKYYGAIILPKNGVPDQIAEFLNSHLKPGDKVQPLDWTGGAIHGMLIAHAPLATRFIYDFHFYHHISDPYIKNLRREFITELTSARPRFIINVFDNKPWPSGLNTSRDFPELQSFINNYYKVVHTGITYNIFERID